MRQRCNCDASCGENRYHNVGESGCMFRSEAEYEAYWAAKRRNSITTGINKMKMNEDDDFGFTFSDSTEIKSTEDKLHGLRKMIMPLLNNLMKNPEKDSILWPDREKKIKAFIKKMDDYINT